MCCHPEPIRFAQGKLHEGSLSMGRSFAALRMTGPGVMVKTHYRGEFQLKETRCSMFSEHTGSNKRYYITTAIYYPNGPPHIGHSLEKVAADVIARFHRLQGQDTCFSMGLDENSQHVVQAAKANNVDLVTWTDSMDEAFRLAWSKLDISYDHWIRQ